VQCGLAAHTVVPVKEQPITLRAEKEKNTPRAFREGGRMKGSTGRIIWYRLGEKKGLREVQCKLFATVGKCVKTNGDLRFISRRAAVGYESVGSNAQMNLVRRGRYPVWRQTTALEVSQLLYSRCLGGAFHGWIPSTPTGF
jgi:hypothetical protein